MLLARPRGYTLMEVMVTVAVIGVLAALAMPRFGRTFERERWQQAGDMLLAIYHGERLYALRNDGVYQTTTPATQAEWRDKLRMDNPTPPDGSVTFAVGAGAGGFSATATRVGGPSNGKTRTINGNRVLGGTWTRP
ncbi:MAG TPA: prepilin-type N-terminal cleavage/methylation domain-containing protein [bacterium]